MSFLLAGIILSVVVAYATSALALLPVAAVVEALPAAEARREVTAWMVALLLPHIAAVAAVVYASRLHALDPVEWAIRREQMRHLSFWWLVGSPDAAYRIRFAALIGCALLAVGLIRPIFSAILAWRYGSALSRSSGHVPELDVYLTPLKRPWSTCVGFFDTRVYLTSGAVGIMNAQELSSVIAHEHAHGTRRDNLRLLAAQALLGPLILMPTSRYVYRRLQAAIERAADQVAAGSPDDRQDLAAALVKAARKLRDYNPDPDEDTVRRRLAGRYREEFVAERAQQLLEADDAPHPKTTQLTLSLATLAMLALLVASVGFLAPTIRSLYESLVAALGA
ncbi:MAG TPA: M48 family metalloprotease [Armatimonadota bacterium]|nr:M48 family metalloprotease [Armatimonadota bacterium]